MTNYRRITFVASNITTYKVVVGNGGVYPFIPLVRGVEGSRFWPGHYVLDTGTGS